MSSNAGTPGPAETERRRITVLFADIAGFTALVEKRDNEQAYEVVTGCLKLLDAIARKHGGSVDKYLGDCIMAVFGLPLAIEDAPRAAVNAAIEMLRGVAAYNRERSVEPPLSVHVGINTGTAIAGDVSGPVLREFAVLGDPVNVASRLKDEAPPGEVWVGEETWRYTREVFRYERLAPLRVKGKERALRAHRLLSRHERIRRPRGAASTSIFSELVGRDGLMDELHGALRGLRQGRGGIHLLIGEAGLGKTRILDELSRAPEAAGANWLRGSGVATRENVAYQVLADLVRMRLAIGEAEPETEAREKVGEFVEAVLPGSAREAAPVVASLLGLPVPPEERGAVEGLSWDALDKVILRTMTELLAALSRGAPQVLVLDDLHWADGSSLRLLERLLRLAHAHPVLFLLGARDGYPETTGRLLGTLARSHAGRFRRHDLGPLPREASRQLLRNLVHQGDVPSGFLARLEEQAGGNPFFMEEVVRSLIETGVLVKGAMGMDLVGHPEDVALPDTVHGVVMARVDRLPRDVRAVLQGACVVGPTVDEAVLRAALPEAEDLGGGLAHLEQAGMLAPLPEGRRWGFPHPLIREVTYDSILASRRAELHGRVAKAVEAHLAEGTPGFHAMLAYHLTHGEDPEAAEPHLFRAGEEASRLAAADEALRLFYDAAQVYLRRHPDGGDPWKRADLERHIARAHANRGELAQAIEHTNLALEALGERVPRTNPGRALHALPGLWAALRMVFLRRMPSRPPATDRERRVIELMFERARAQVTTMPAPNFVFECFDTFRKIAAVDARSLTGVGGMLAGMVGPLAWGGVSLSLSRRFLELAEPLVDADDPAEGFFYRTMRVLHHHQGGDWRDDDEIPPPLVDAALRRGLLWDVTNYLLFLAERRLCQGRFREAAGIVEELARIAEVFHYDLARSTERYVRLLLHVERGELDRALPTAEAYYTEHPEKLLNLLALGNRAKAELLGGDLDGGRATLTESGRLLSGIGYAPAFHQLPHWRSCLLLDVMELRAGPRARRIGGGPGRRARQHARRALGSARRVAIRGPEVLRLDAERLWRLGRRRAAVRRAEASLAAAERLQAGPERARTHATIARLLDEDGAARVAGLDGAGHRAESERLRDALEPFAWGDALAPGGADRAGGLRAG